MICSPRLKRILNRTLQLQDDEYITIDTLASLLKTSRRTVFRELENVNDLLMPSGLKLESKAGKGIRLTGSPAQKEALAEALCVDDISYVNKEERRKLLAFELLRTQEVRKLIYYANMFQVSESTISHDIEALEPVLNESQIRIHREGKNRIIIQASEARRRNAMMRIVHDQMSLLDTADLASHSDEKLQEIFMNNTPESIMSLLNQDILRRVLQIFSMNRHELNLDRFYQSSYIGLILHLVIAVERILKDESINASQDVLSLIKDDASYEEAKAIAAELEKEFDIEIPEVETAFIAMHLQGSKVTSQKDASGHYEQSPQSRKAARFAEDLIEGFDIPTQMALRHDDQFLQGILTHLEPALIRLENHLPIYNPLLGQLKSQYADLFARTRRAADLLETKYDVQISDEEVGFITMHVGASLERDSLKTIQRPIRLGIVCASGIGVSALLAARVQKQFQARVHVRTLAMEDVRHHNYGGSELLLSTFPLSESGIESIQVSPLLSEKDIERIEARLNVHAQNAVFTAQKNQIGYPEQLKMISDLCLTQKDILDHLKIVQTESADDLDHLIWKAAASLDGDSAAIYHDLLEREKLGSVIAEDYGFAMFHAASEAAVHPQIVLIYPKDETFHTPALEKVRFIAAAVIPKSGSRYQRETMSIISSSLIEDDLFLKTITTRDEKRIKDQLIILMRRYLEEKLREFSIGS